jgi:hypothetical protein
MNVIPVPDRTDLSLGLLIAGAVMAGAFPNAPWWLVLPPLVAAACLMWFRSTEANLLWYAATFAIEIPHNLMPIRLSVADLFMLPVIAREVWSWGRGVAPVRSTLMRPLIFLVATAAVATVVGYMRMGRFTSWMLVNKDAGLIFQAVGCLALLRYAQSTQRIHQLARWFVYGLSAANILALVYVLLALAGVQNRIFDVNGRFFGLIGNPSANGGLLIAAAMIEIGLLAGAPAYGARGVLRYVNVCGFGLALALTLSRSAWLALAVASSVLLALLVVRREMQVRQRPAYAMMLAAWVVVPAGVLGSILAANVLAGLSFSPEGRAAQLRAQFDGDCAAGAADPGQPCATPAPAAAAAPAVAAAPPPAVAAAPAPAAPPAATVPAQAAPLAAASPAPAAPEAVDLAPVAAPAPVAPVVADPPPAPAPTAELEAAPSPELDTAMMNSRGLMDRVAILDQAWKAYTEDAASMVFGIGLGTFYATSAAQLAVPLIIHNTFAWFLVEFGPLGLIAVLWIWAQTTRNLHLAAAAGNEQRFLAYGALAAFAGLTVFCLFNEGFYQRQLWLVIAMADRLRLVADTASAI